MIKYPVEEESFHLKPISKKDMAVMEKMLAENLYPRRIFNERPRKNPEVILPKKWQFLKVDTALIRSNKATKQKLPELSSPDDVVRFTLNVLGDLEISDRERVYAIFLDYRNHPVGLHEVHIGTATESHLHPRELFKSAILTNASGIILVHNHPSGDSEPSTSDLVAIERIKSAGKILGIVVLDFIIIGTRGKFYSAKMEGKM